MLNGTGQEHHLLNANYFKQFDEALDSNKTGPHWLKEKDLALIVADSLHYNDGRLYELFAFTIMSNHVHAVFTALPSAPPLHIILQRHKTFTAKLCNVQLKRLGKFWQHESYDHLVRGDVSFWRVLHYILHNPVKAGLVEYWQDYKWTWIKEEFKELF